MSRTPSRAQNSADEPVSETYSEEERILKENETPPSPARVLNLEDADAGEGTKAAAEPSPLQEVLSPESKCRKDANDELVRSFDDPNPLYVLAALAGLEALEDAPKDAPVRLDWAKRMYEAYDTIRVELTDLKKVTEADATHDKYVALHYEHRTLLHDYNDVVQKEASYQVDVSDLRKEMKQREEKHQEQLDAQLVLFQADQDEAEAKHKEELARVTAEAQARAAEVTKLHEQLAKLNEVNGKLRNTTMALKAKENVQTAAAPPSIMAMLDVPPATKEEAIKRLLTAVTPVRLNLPSRYEDKDLLKATSAIYDGARKTWFIPAGQRLWRVARWATTPGQAAWTGCQGKV